MSNPLSNETLNPVSKASKNDTPDAPQGFVINTNVGPVTIVTTSATSVSSATASTAQGEKPGTNSKHSTSAKSNQLQPSGTTVPVVSRVTLLTSSQPPKQSTELMTSSKPGVSNQALTILQPGQISVPTGQNQSGAKIVSNQLTVTPVTPFQVGKSLVQTSTNQQKHPVSPHMVTKLIPQGGGGQSTQLQMRPMKPGQQIQVQGRSAPVIMGQIQGPARMVSQTVQIPQGTWAVKPINGKGTDGKGSQSLITIHPNTVKMPGKPISVSQTQPRLPTYAQALQPGNNIKPVSCIQSRPVASSTSLQTNSATIVTNRINLTTPPIIPVGTTRLPLVNVTTKQIIGAPQPGNKMIHISPETLGNVSSSAVGNTVSFPITYSGVTFVTLASSLNGTTTCVTNSTTQAINSTAALPAGKHIMLTSRSKAPVEVQNVLPSQKSFILTTGGAQKESVGSVAIAPKPGEPEHDSKSPDRKDDNNVSSTTEDCDLVKISETEKKPTSKTAGNALAMEAKVEKTFVEGGKEEKKMVKVSNKTVILKESKSKEEKDIEEKNLPNQSNSPRETKTEPNQIQGVQSTASENDASRLKEKIKQENSQSSHENADPSKEKEEENMSIDNGDDTFQEYDADEAMQWDNGIGTLEGSDLKFKRNEFGVLEVVTESLECDEVLNSSSEMEDINTSENKRKQDFHKNEDSKDSHSLSDADIKDEVCQCENCGEYGFASEFCQNGRFCGQECANSYDSKKSGRRKAEDDDESMIAKKKKKKEELDVLKISSKFGKKYRESFSWTDYLEQEKAEAAPNHLFKEAFPERKNGFKLGMKLEGIDPRHQSLFCVLSVSEIRGYRVRLHFDGYSECYDFWTNADSDMLFPVGFCEKHNKPLQPPKGFTEEDFKWNHYLKVAKSVAAPKHLFLNLPNMNAPSHEFKVGSKLEAVDKKNSNLICVSTVIDTLGDRVLIRFDGWEDTYDYWTNIDSPNLHPVGWCHENNKALSLPCDWKDNEEFSWEKYLEKTNSNTVPEEAFKPRKPIGFKAGMKLEVVDKRNPILIRVASIAKVEGHLLKIHFDGWDDVYDYWVDDDSPDIHPPHWCSRTGHSLCGPIEPLVGPEPSFKNAPGCPTHGCRGIGHIKGAKYTGHHSEFGCPYSKANMNRETTLQDRISCTRNEELYQTPVPSPTGSQKTVKTEYVFPEGKKCPYPGCDGQGHVTGKFPFHYKLSGCPLSAGNQNNPNYRPEIPKPRTKSTRGRKPRSYYLNMGDRLLPSASLKKDRLHSREDRGSEQNDVIHESVFMPTVIPNENKDLPLGWDQHSKLLPGINKVRGNNVSRWSVEQVVSFIRSLPGCEDFSKTFKDELIDGEALLMLTQNDLVKILNVKLGPALKIFNSILMFKKSIEI